MNTFMNGYPHEIRRPDDWCDYRQWQEDHISMSANEVVCRFEMEYKVPLSKCKTLSTALLEAFALASYLADNEKDAYPSIVARRFLELIRKPQKLPHDLPQIFDDLWKAFEVRPRTKPEREPIRTV